MYNPMNDTNTVFVTIPDCCDNFAYITVGDGGYTVCYYDGDSWDIMDGFTHATFDDAMADLLSC